MEACEAREICMWNCVSESKKATVFTQLSHLHNIMYQNFSGILFRNALDYIFSYALLPDDVAPRLVTSHFRAIMPRSQDAEVLILNNKGFNAARKHIKVEHITSIKTLGMKFRHQDFEFVCKNFNVCIVTNSEYDFLGKGCGHERYGSTIKLLVPQEKMIIRSEA